MPTGELAEACRSPAQGLLSRTCWLARIALILYVVFLFWIASVSDRREPSLQLEDVLQLGDWVAGIVMTGALVGARFFLLGLLAALSTGPFSEARGLSGASARWLWVLLVGLALLVLLSMAALGRPVGASLVVFPLAGYAAGAWVGVACLRGRRAMLWLVPQLGFLLLALGGAATGVAFLAFEKAPLPFQPPQITSAEKRRLADVLEHSQRTDGRRKRLRLSGDNVNLLMAMAMAQSPLTGKAKAALTKGAAEGDLSVKMPHFPTSPCYVNVHLACRAGVTAGRPEIRFEQCRIGRLPVPRLLLDDVSRLVTSAILNDPDCQQALAAIDSVRLEPENVEIVYRSSGLSDEVIPSLLARLGQKPDVLMPAQIYYRHLVRAAEQLPQEDRFQAFLQSAFQLAQERSRREDPVLENRAAILALAILLGHWRVESLVGPVTDGDLRLAARRHVGRVTLRGRRDWCQHFLVSAALALVSNQSLSDEAGLFKEELDAGEGGSGFSFCDLLADRAGTLFALAATRDGPAARQVQHRLAAGFPIADLFPPAADLPEGIPDPALQADYGGVGGKGYQAVLCEIERRLATCAALR